jgi:hypothetical protein
MNKKIADILSEDRWREVYDHAYLRYDASGIAVMFYRNSENHSMTIRRMCDMIELELHND